MNKSLGVSRRATKDTKAIKKKIVIFCTYFITKTISDLFSQQWFDFSYFPHFWEPDSIFQKLERFGRNLLMSLELLRVCPDFTPHSSFHLCWIYLAFEKCCKLVIIGAEEVNRNPLKFKMIPLPKKLSWVWCCHMHPRLSSSRKVHFTASYFWGDWRKP